MASVLQPHSPLFLDGIGSGDMLLLQWTRILVNVFADGWQCAEVCSGSLSQHSTLQCGDLGAWHSHALDMLH